MEQKIITVMGTCGGCGKSTIAKELAITYSSKSINRNPLSVCLIDASLGLGSQQTLFHLAPKYYLEDWLFDLTTKAEHMDDLDIVNHYDWDAIEKYLSYSPQHNLYILPSDSRSFEYLDCYNLLDLDVNVFYLMMLSLKKYFDIIIIDTGCSHNHALLSSMLLSDKVLLVVTDEPRSMKNIGIAKQLIRDNHIPSIKFFPIMNMYPQRKNERFYDIEKISHITIGHVLSFDKRVWTLNNMNDAVVLQRNDSELKIQLLQLAVRLVPEFADSMIF